MRSSYSRFESGFAAAPFDDPPSSGLFDEMAKFRRIKTHDKARVVLEDLKL